MAATIENDATELSVQPTDIIPPQKASIDKMSTAGVANATAGTILADLIEYAFLGEGNRPATKNDIAALFNKLNRYHLIANLPPRPFGKLPYFDLHTNEIVYF